MEQKKIKGTKKTQKNKNETITKCNRYINLGVNSTFEVGATAYILSETEYNDLNDKANVNDDNNITELKELLTDKEKEIAKLNDTITTLETSNNDLTVKVGAYETDISQLNLLIQQKETELSKYTAIDIDKLTNDKETLETENKELSKQLGIKTDYIVYLEQLQTDYKELINYFRNKNFLTPLLNAIGLSDIDKPQLKHIDMKGNKTDKNNEPILTESNSTDANS